MTDTDSAQFIATHKREPSGQSLHRCILDLLDLVDRNALAENEDQIKELQLIYLACNKELQFFIGSSKSEILSTKTQESHSGVIKEIDQLFPLRSQQLRLDNAVTTFLVDLEKEVAQLSMLTADHSRRVFKHFQSRADAVLTNEQQAIILTLGLIIMAVIALLLVHRQLVVRGFSDRLTQISEAMARVPSEASHTQVAVSGKDEIAYMARALEGLLAQALKLKQLATKDELTGVDNRRRFFELAAIVAEQVKREAKPACVLMLDIDLFKSVNDTYGHDAGDKTLRLFAETCLSVIRPTDPFARIGGEEFALLLPGADKDSGMVAGERIRKAVEVLRVPIDNGEELHITLSLGMTLVDLASTSIDYALQQADQALYQAKSNGRNQLVFWNDGAQ